ncbi:hypothetical protein PRUPE_8G237200 [Prunus persica]|uniref:ADP-ribosyl cyclase/cyclic ADP-ribose hydrolase n=1 Tax=Prunus persica TaxID=3760 RepID=A0A251N5M1_PRUPE|nr:disease resistance protein RPS6 [Prunus persica]ONH93544.1 hypothetical protein PRUPE_8G237200 [Prunus persica]
MNSSSSSPPFAAPLQEKYDVFLSFRGQDTRDTFTSHLHAALLRKKIETYMDRRLEKGDNIEPALLEAIEKSKISVVIFSKNYASSTWCLKELVHILGCKERYGQIVIPIFYCIDPSHVRKQQGTYILEGLQLKKRFKGSRDEVVNWRAALEEAANMSGFHHSSKTGTAADFVEKVVQDILTKLNRESSSDLKGLVGIERKIEKIESLLCLSSPGVCCVGIWGMAGIGKTTLVDAVFHRQSSKFEAACFLANVREKSEQTGGPNQLLNKLVRKILKDKDITIDTLSIGQTSIQARLRRTKALIVLDDVNASSQLEVLVGDHDRFCQGSRIIITARDKGVLEEKVDNEKIYEVEGLSFNEALQLFHSHAFKNKSPTTDYIELSKEVVEYVKGIPLALKVMGSSFLRCKSKQEWEDQWNKLKRFPSEEIKKALRVSYDGLEENEKEIFLDIACFHKDENIDGVKRMLYIRGFYGEVGIKVLIDRSLISIWEGWIAMHDLLQEMGRAIVREQCIEEPRKRSRLFIAEDVYQVLANNQRTATVQAIFFDWSKIEKLNLNHANFEKMYQLRWLRVNYPRFLKNITLIDSLDLPNSLSYLEWEGYPLKSLPSKFSPENLVELHMPFSEVGAQLWNKDQNLINLKVISLRSSDHLTEVPNLSQSQKIERIDLYDCNRLVEIPSYFKYLNKLTNLELGRCRKLKTLPDMPCNVEFLDLSKTAIEELPSSVWSHEKISELDIRYCRDLKSLPSSSCKPNASGTFSLCGCKSLCEFPELPRNTTVLDLSKTGIKDLPSSIKFVFGLTTIKLVACKSLVSLPMDIWNLKSLKSLDLSRCSNFQHLPKISDPVEHLEFLNLSGTAVEELLPSVGNLVALKYLVLHKCKNLEVVPNSIYSLSNLKTLSFNGCSELKKLPPVLIDRVGLVSLEALNLAKCSILEIPDGLVCLTSLQILNLRETNIKSIPASIKHAAHLSCLFLTDCKSLKSLPELPPLLQRLEAHGCTSLKTVSSSSTALAQGWGEYIFYPRLHEKYIFSSCTKLDQNARSNIMVDARLRIMRMATAWSKFKEEKIEQSSYDSDDDYDYDSDGYDSDSDDYDSEDYDLNDTDHDPDDMMQENFIAIKCWGYEIPNWFSHQSEGSSINIKLPPDWFSTDFLGFALSLVIAFNKDYAEFSMKIGCKYNFKTSNGESHEINHPLHPFANSGSSKLHQVYVWWYNNVFEEVVEGAQSPTAFYKLVTEVYVDFSVLGFANKPYSELEVEKCGICLLYAQDAESIKKRIL